MQQEENKEIVEPQRSASLGMLAYQLPEQKDLVLTELTKARHGNVSRAIGIWLEQPNNMFTDKDSAVSQAEKVENLRRAFQIEGFFALSTTGELERGHEGRNIENSALLAASRAAAAIIMAKGIEAAYAAHTQNSVLGHDTRVTLGQLLTYLRKNAQGTVPVHDMWLDVITKFEGTVITTPESALRLGSCIEEEGYWIADTLYSWLTSYKSAILRAQRLDYPVAGETEEETAEQKALKKIREWVNAHPGFKVPPEDVAPADEQSTFEKFLEDLEENDGPGYLKQLKLTVEYHKVRRTAIREAQEATSHFPDEQVDDTSGFAHVHELGRRQKHSIIIHFAGMEAWKVLAMDNVARLEPSQPPTLSQAGWTKLFKLCVPKDYRIIFSIYGGARHPKAWTQVLVEFVEQRIERRAQRVSVGVSQGNKKKSTNTTNRSRAGAGSGKSSSKAGSGLRSLVRGQAALVPNFDDLKPDQTDPRIKARHKLTNTEFENYRQLRTTEARYSFLLGSAKGYGDKCPAGVISLYKGHLKELSAGGGSSRNTHHNSPSPARASQTSFRGGRGGGRGGSSRPRRDRPEVNYHEQAQRQMGEGRVRHVHIEEVDVESQGQSPRAATPHPRYDTDDDDFDYTEAFNIEDHRELTDNDEPNTY
jgi:hypothetical protein